MRRTLLALAVTASVVTQVHAAAPASAIQAGEATFFGTGLVPQGLTYPGVTTGSCQYTTYVKAVTPPPVHVKEKQQITNTLPTCQQSAWIFNTTVCVESHATVLKGSHKAPASAGLCLFIASGTLAGWCGATSGEGTGIFIDSQNQRHVFRIVWTQNVNTSFPFTGEITKQDGSGHQGRIDGVIDAVPIPFMTIPVGNTCADPEGATHFTTVGQFAYTEG